MMAISDQTMNPDKKLELLSVEDQDNSTSILRHWRTFAATFSAALGACVVGTVFGYSSPAVPDINSEGNIVPFRLDNIDIALLTSLIAVGAFVGEIAGGFMSDRFGRKTTMMYNSLIMVVGWVLVGCAPNVACLQVGRVITGFASGVVDITVPVYISEISEKSVRGFMCSCFELFINIGFLLVFTFGIFLHWDWIAIVCAVIPAVMVILLCFVPESPRWIASNDGKDEKEKKENAMKALHWLRGKTGNRAEEEYQEIINNINVGGSDMKWKELGQPVLYKPVVIVVGLMFFQQMAGYGVLPEYMVNIFQSAGSNWSPYVQTAVVGVAGVVANFISCLVVDRTGRRLMLFVSSAIMVVSLGGLASFFTIKCCTTSDNLISYLLWLPIVSLILFNFGVALGYGPIPFYLCSELLPLRARSKAGGMSISLLCVFFFFTTFSFNWLREALNEFGIYWMMSGFALLGFIFIYFVPETKGKSLEEIEANFRN